MEETACVNGQKTTPRIRRWNVHAGSQKSTPWSRHPASENAAQQRCRGLFSVSQHALEEDEIETDSCKSSSPSVSSQLLKHGSSIVGVVQKNPKFTSCRATNTSCKDICQQVFEAAHKGDAATVESLLLQHSISPDLANTDKRTLLMVACAEGHVSMVQALLRCKASVNIADSDGFTPLHVAASQGNCEVVKMLLSSTHHPDVNTRANDLSSVLMRPAERGFSIVVEYLLENNANPNIVNHHGWTPLMKAATKGHKDVLRVLLEHGADVNITSTEDSTTALNEAVLNGHTEAITMLVNAHSKSVKKNRALYTCKTSEEMRRLIKDGAKVDQHQGDRSTPLMVHAEAGRTELVKELISQGAPLDAQDQNGMTALMRAAQHGHFEVVKVLVANDSILDIKCKKRKTALIYAIQGGGHKEVVKELCTAGANVSIKDKNGQTAADIAEEMEYTEISALFRKRRSSQTVSSTDPFLEQMSKYLSKGPTQEQEKSHLSTKSSKGSASVAVPARSKQLVQDESGILKKELNKAYERIAALEGRNQELTLQTTGQELIKRDDELSCLPHEHLVEDYKKLKMMKKKADQFANEARQTAQKLSVENFRLKEELSREKHAHELHWKNVVGEVEQKLDKSKEAIKRAEERAHVAETEYTELMRRVMQTSNPESLSMSLQHEIITPRDLYRIIFEGRKFIEIQFAMVAIGGLPYSGKTELLNSMYPHDTIHYIPSDSPHRCFARHIDGLDIYELGYLKDPVSETPEWIPATGKACHFYMIAAALAKDAGTNKFPCLKARGEQQLQRFKSQHLNKHFNRVFDEVGKALSGFEKKWHPQALLRGPKTVLMNVWDIGVHKALYEVLPLLARAFGRLVLVNILDLARDTKRLDKQPELTNEKYNPREESNIVMKTRSRLHYYIRIAGLTKSAKGDQCPTTLLVATHKDKFADPDEAERTRKDLQSLAWQKAVDTGVSEVLYPQLLAVNALDQDDGQKVRHIIEEMIDEGRKFDMKMPMTWMFLRSTLYNYPHVYIKWSEFDKMATECGLRTDDEKERFLTIFTHSGSLLYYPELPALKENIVLFPEHFLKDLEHLYYPQISVAASVKAHKDVISAGILCNTVAEEIWKESSPFYLQLLQDSGLAVDISDASLYKTTCCVCSNKKPNCLFMPSLCTDGNRHQLPSQDSDSLFVTFNSEYVPTDVQALFAKYLKQELTEIELKFTHQSNTTTFKFPTTSKLHGVLIYIIVHGNVIEIKIQCDTQCQEDIIIALCGHLKTISVQILDGVVKYFPGMEYKLAFPCPNSVARNRRTIHYLHFHPVASDIDCLFCWHCCKYINLTNGRRRWLKAAYMKV